MRAGFIRGGNWNNGSNDGVETLNLNNMPVNTNNNIGFRCARLRTHYFARILAESLKHSKGSERNAIQRPVPS